jgi:SAM-dependent methyltransferase
MRHTVSELDPARLDWKSLTFQDPIGSVFRHEGEIYRAIYPEAVGHVRSLLESGVIDRLVERKLLVETAVSDIAVQGYPLVLHHQRIPYPTYKGQWPPTLVRDAARLVVELNLELLERGLGTVDYHIGNVEQSDACRPIWLDLGSIQPLSQAARTPRAILGEFRRTVREGRLKEDFSLRWAGISGIPERVRRDYLYPVALLAKDPRWGRLVRAFLNSGGISDEEYRLLSRGSRFGRFGQDRRRWLKTMRGWLDDLELPVERASWAKYPADPLALADPISDARAAVVERVIRDQRPRKVVDLGCNAGFSTTLASRASPGCQIYAVDSDEVALEALCRGARDRISQGSVTVVLDDVVILSADALRVDPGGESSLLVLRDIQGDLTLALGLSHHLYFRQYCRFPLIAKVLSSFTTDALLTEFMPNGLGGTAPQPDPLPTDYNLGEFACCLKQRFRDVEVIRPRVTSGDSPRILLHARGKR